MRTLIVFLATTALLSSGVAARALSGPEMEARTVDIATRYLEVWSSSDARAVQAVPYVYGPRVQFYGRNYSQADLTAEKQRAVRQWPVRHYVHRPGTIKVVCNVELQRCGVRSITDFQVANPARGTAKRGSARFDLGVSFQGPQPRILYEGGSLGRRRG